MERRRKPVQLPADLWERIKRKAEREGRKMADVLRDLIGQIPDFDQPTTPQERTCIFCGRPSGSRRICDECFYDPSVVRPQVIGAIFYHYGMAVARDLGIKPTWEAFEQWLTKDIAIDFYGLTEDEWNYYEEWRKWKEAFRNGTTTKEDDRWRHYCRRGIALGFVGDRAGFRCLTVLFSVVGKKPTTRPSTF
jgi:hypothetical protein